MYTSRRVFVVFSITFVGFFTSLSLATDCQSLECGPWGLCNATSSSCICPAGFYGTNCSLLDPCHGNDCNLRGRCENGSCICDSGWKGANCTEEDLCGCKQCGHGSCDEETGLCVCPSSYGGSQCNVKLCGNDGAYDPVNDTCICNRGYAGDTCSECDVDGPTEGTLWICVPNGRGSYLLDWIPLADAPGTYPGGPTSVDAIYPDSTGYKGGYYDCACRLSSSTISPAVTDYTNQAKKKVDSVLIVAIVLSSVGGVIIAIVVTVAVGMFSRMRWRRKKKEKSTSRTRILPSR